MSRHSDVSFKNQAAKHREVTYEQFETKKKQNQMNAELSGEPWKVKMGSDINRIRKMLLHAGKERECRSDCSQKG